MIINFKNGYIIQVILKILKCAYGRFERFFLSLVEIIILAILLVLWRE